MAYYRHIELKVKIEKFEQYLEDCNNKFFSGLLNITKFNNKEYSLEYDDMYFVGIEIDDDENTIDFRFNLKYRMNEIIMSIFTQYIAEKIAKYDAYLMEYDKILYDEIEGDYINIYENDALERYFKYVFENKEYLEDDFKDFVDKIKRNKRINKLKMYFNLY